MSDELDALKAALKAAAKANPTPDPDAKAAAMRLAMENFDRLQGSRDPKRLSQDRPARAGFLNGVRDMLESLKARPILAATTSVAALCIGLFIVLPQVNGLPELAKPDLKATEIIPPTPKVSGKDEAAKIARSDDALVLDGELALNRPETVTTETGAGANGNMLTEPAPVEMDKMAGAVLDAPALPMSQEMKMAPQADGMADAMVVGEAAPMDMMLAPPEPNTEAFANAPVNPVHVTAEEPVSTFSVDVDTASYSVIRSSLNAGQLPPSEAVRIEEMVNYFPYDYPAPKAGEAPFTDTVTVMPTPWNPNTRLVHIALQGRMPDTDSRPPLNLVFLIDTSGSMDEPNKLPLLKQSLSLMLGKLSPQDQVAIVAYAGSAGEVLPPTRASDQGTILNALDRLAAGGSTAGAEGLALAYQVAQGMKRDGAISRVLLATDGDFNVGIDDPEDLKTFVAHEREAGTYLSVLGFGRGNLDDATMQALAQNGNGTASYIDTLSEAQKVLVDQLTGALFPIADDVKIQVEWNPAQVAEYRLIGYETRALKREDFNNDKIDAGEIGAGLQVTALYEVTAPGSPALLNDPLRYGPAPEASASTELGFLRLRYKDPGQTVSNLIETPILGSADASDDARFAAAMAGFGQLLQGSSYIGNWGWDQAIALTVGAKGDDEFGYRVEAVNLMRLAQSLSN